MIILIHNWLLHLRTYKDKNHLLAFNVLLLDTCTVILVDDGLLRTSTGCAGPSGSLTLYTDWLKDTTMSIGTIIHTYAIC